MFVMSVFWVCSSVRKWGRAFLLFTLHERTQHTHTHSCGFWAPKDNGPKNSWSKQWSFYCPGWAFAAEVDSFSKQSSAKWFLSINLLFHMFTRDQYIKFDLYFFFNLLHFASSFGYKQNCTNHNMPIHPSLKPVLVLWFKLLLRCFIFLLSLILIFFIKSNFP